MCAYLTELIKSVEREAFSHTHTHTHAITLHMHLRCLLFTACVMLFLSIHFFHLLCYLSILYAAAVVVNADCT